jgi:oligoribonuclease
VAAVTANVDADNRLAWIDLEMTGLDVNRHVIVEIACIITDSELKPLDDGIDIVIRPEPAELAEMDDFVRGMHTKSRLLDAMQASTTDLPTATAQTLAYVQSHVSAPRTAPVCGNSIGVDRRFLDHYMPTLDQYLHYRSIDVSSFKELCRRWYPAIYKKRPGKNEAHRALGDIRESIEELRYYREHLFIAAPTTGSAE